MTIELMIQIVQIKDSNKDKSISHALVGYCYLVSKTNLREQLLRKREKKQVFTSLEDIEMKCCELECSLNDLIMDERCKYAVDYSFNFTEEQEEILLKIMRKDNHYYSGYTSKICRAVKTMLENY